MLETLTQQALMKAGAICALGFAAMGSAYGCGVAAASAIGQWKKCYIQGKPAPFQLAILTGFPISQTIYGFILMFMLSNHLGADVFNWPVSLAIGVVGGIAIALSAAFQGRAAAGACDAFAESGMGFAYYIVALGIIETVAIFVMAFALILIGKFAAVSDAVATAASAA